MTFVLLDSIVTDKSQVNDMNAGGFILICTSRTGKNLDPKDSGVYHRLCYNMTSFLLFYRTERVSMFIIISSKRESFILYTNRISLYSNHVYYLFSSIRISNKFNLYE